MRLPFVHGDVPPTILIRRIVLSGFGSLGQISGALHIGTARPVTERARKLDPTLRSQRINKRKMKRHRLGIEIWAPHDYH
jgi:hypothetical protein